MPVIRTKYAQTKVCDTPLFTEVTSVQEIFSIKSIDETGIFELNEKRFSKLYTLSDINFAGATDEEQKSMIRSFSDVLKSITCRFSYTVANEYVDEAAFKRKILYGKKKDAFDQLRKNFNKIIETKVEDARQGLYQTIYLTLTIEASDMSEAKKSFFSMESALKSAFIGIGNGGMQGSVMRAVGIDERMQLLFNLTHMGIETTGYKFSFEEALAERQDWKNIISPAAVCFENECFRINNHVGKVMYIQDYPKELQSQILSKLSSVNCTSYVSVNSELLDLSGLKQEISRKYMAVGMKIENEKQRNRNNNDYLADASMKLLNEKEKLDDFSKDIDGSDDRYFNTTTQILFFAKDMGELKRIEEHLLKDASFVSAELKSCFGKQREGLNSSIGLGIQEFKRVCNLSSSCLAMFMPYKTQELNHENGCYYGINKLSSNVIRADKKKLKNHNGLILGQSGSGKSVFVKMEILSTFLNQEHDHIIIIDPQSEYGPIAAACRGTIISFDSTREYYLNPMDVDFTGVDYGRLDEIIGEKSDFILTLLSCCLKRDMRPEEDTVIDEVVRRVYSANYATRMRLNGVEKESSPFTIPEYLRGDSSRVLIDQNLSPAEQIRLYSPTLQDVYQGLIDEGSQVAQHLAAAMGIFVNGSLNFFNHRTNVEMENRMLVFDLSGLKDNIRTISMLVMMETVRNRIKDNAKDHNWTHLYVDEFHELLVIDQVEEFILKLWKEIRKMNGILNGITQNMTDLLKNENNARLTAILSNTEYFALLSQSSFDKRMLMQFLPNISAAMFNHVDNADPGTGILKMGNITVPFDMKMDKNNEIYRIVNTDGGAYGV